MFFKTKQTQSYITYLRFPIYNRRQRASSHFHILLYWGGGAVRTVHTVHYGYAMGGGRQEDVVYAEKGTLWQIQVPPK